MLTNRDMRNRDVTVFTIGFAQKSAREFFELLTQAGVKTLIDIRLNNVSQLAGFTKKNDLAYFLEAIASIDYIHRPDLAPTKELLDGYKKKQISWDEFQKKFNAILKKRQAEGFFQPNDVDNACLLCSEPTADKCHRRLVAEYLSDKWGNVDIQHL